MMRVPVSLLVSGGAAMEMDGCDMHPASGASTHAAHDMAGDPAPMAVILVRTGRRTPGRRLGPRLPHRGFVQVTEPGGRVVSWEDAARRDACHGVCQAVAGCAAGSPRIRAGTGTGCGERLHMPAARIQDVLHLHFPVAITLLPHGDNPGKLAQNAIETRA